ncbi:MAG: dihydroorotate dehydrogenase [Actinomycetota bacterium]
MSPSLAVDVGGVRLATPVMNAAGCLRDVKNVAGVTDLRRLGAIVTTSVTLWPVQGSPLPRAAETPSGLLSSVGLQNPGVEEFVVRDLPSLTKLGVPIIASVAGTSVEEFVRVATAVQDAPGVVAIETNLACPNEERGGGLFAHRPDHAAEASGAVARLSRVPVFAKLSVDVSDLPDIASACVEAGADGVTLINSVQAMAVDSSEMAPKLGSVLGGLSGPAIRPLAVRAVYQVSRVLPGIPIIGVGGVTRARDAIELLLAGASAVQVGTAMLANPSAPQEITDGIAQFLEEAGVANPSELRGRIKLSQTDGA